MYFGLFVTAGSQPYKYLFYAASFGCLFLICRLHIIAELVHHLQESLIDDLLPVTGTPVFQAFSALFLQECVSRQTVSKWLDTSIWMSAAPLVSGNKST